jgi:hypothetical protein
MDGAPALSVAAAVADDGVVIELADTALEAWLATLDPRVDVTFERPEPSGSTSRKPVLSLVLTALREQTDKRDNQVIDVRDGERVVARRRAVRFFELDYQCSVAGPARDAHRALGDVVQLVVDCDVIPAKHVPAELAALGHPIDVQLVAATGAGAAVTLRVVLPVEPTPEREIAPPATSLHLDMMPPPGDTSAPEVVRGEIVPIEERRWTTVRRREMISHRAVAAAADEAAGSAGRPKRKEL